MRVLFYNANRSAALGGVEHLMLDVAQGPRERGHRALVYGRAEAGWFREAAARGLPRIAGAFGMEFHPRALIRLATVLRTHRIDVVVAKGKKGVRLAALGTHLARRGAVVLFLGLEGELSDRAIDRWTWRYAVDRAVVVAEEAKAWYERLGWTRDGRLAVVLKGVDTERFDPRRADRAAARAELGLPPDGFVVGSVGRLVWQKGHVFLLRAVARLVAGGREMYCLLVGSGEEKGRLEAEANALGIAERVVFAGYRPDVAELLAAMDVFVLPSRRENMAQVLLEAMAMARPVVSTASIGVREVLIDGSSGFIVPVGDAEALAARIATLADSSDLRAAMGARARARIEDGFTRKEMLARVEKVLAPLCTP